MPRLIPSYYRIYFTKIYIWDLVDLPASLLMYRIFLFNLVRLNFEVPTGLDTSAGQWLEIGKNKSKNNVLCD